MSPEEATRRFDERRPILEAFGRHVVESLNGAILQQLGPGERTGFFQIEPKFRVKDSGSFREKITRRGKNYDEPLVQITDQVGVRIVVLLAKHTVLVNQSINGMPEWDVTRARDVQKEREKNPHYFDYVSDHWVVHLKSPHACGDITITPDIPCEIQVRTLLQHAYAELAHSTVYKPNLTAKPDVLRAIAKGAALVETTDGVFSEVAQKIETHTEALVQQLGRAEDWFRKNVGDPIENPADESRAMRILDAYAALFQKADWEAIERELSSRAWLPDWLRNQQDSDTIFRHPVILLVVWLVVELEHDVAPDWPLDLELLRPVFAKLGISTDGALD